LERPDAVQSATWINVGAGGGLRTLPNNLIGWQNCNTVRGLDLRGPVWRCWRAPRLSVHSRIGDRPLWRAAQSPLQMLKTGADPTCTTLCRMSPPVTTSGARWWQKKPLEFNVVTTVTTVTTFWLW